MLFSIIVIQTFGFLPPPHTHLEAANKALISRRNSNWYRQTLNHLLAYSYSRWLHLLSKNEIIKSHSARVKNPVWLLSPFATYPWFSCRMSPSSPVTARSLPVDVEVGGYTVPKQVCWWTACSVKYIVGMDVCIRYHCASHLRGECLLPLYCCKDRTCG